MKFRKVDEDTILCEISQQDLQDHDIAVEDLLHKKPRALAYIQEVARYAAKESDFALEGKDTSVQLKVRPDKSLSLTLSRKKSESKPAGKPKARKKRGKPQEKLSVPDSYPFYFADLQGAIRCSRAIVGHGEMNSALYRCKKREGYLLLVSRNDLSGPDFEKQVISISEFGEVITAGLQSSLVQEHGQCLIADHAIEQMAGL